jgi:hypothetical protein
LRAGRARGGGGPGGGRAPGGLFSWFFSSGTASSYDGGGDSADMACIERGRHSQESFCPLLHRRSALRPEP